MKAKYQLAVWLGLKALRFLANQTENDFTESLADFLEEVFLGTADSEKVRKIIEVVEPKDKE